MPATWQCDDCGTTYRVAWLSHCYRCEGEGRAPKPKPKTEKPSRSRRGRMPRIVAGVGPSNADEAQPEPELVEDAPVVEPEPVAPAVEPEPEPVVEEAAPEPVAAPAPVQDAPVADLKGATA